jgi:HEAT repeat protein
MVMTTSDTQKLVGQLKQFADTDQAFSISSLRSFSNLDSQQVSSLWDTWIAIPVKRRVRIAQELRDMAEDNVDLNFQPLFLKCLEDADDRVRSLAIDGLWEDETLSTLRRLLQLFEDDPSPRVHESVMLSLSRFAYRAELGSLPEEYAQRVYTVLLQTLQDTSKPMVVRRRALEGVAYYSDSPDVQKEIRHASTHNDQYMRESALVAMGRSMNPEWFPTIKKALHSVSPALRFEAAKAVGELAEEGRELLGSLIPLVEDNDPEVLQAAIWALGQVGGSEAQRVLERLARSKDEMRSQAAHEALEALMLFHEDSLF